MPHVVISCFKADIPLLKLDRIQQEIAQILEQELACSPVAISVDLKQIEPDSWREQVYLPNIAPRMDALIRKPGYSYDGA
jgi:4-oxalocrotonate tautomerase